MVSRAGIQRQIKHGAAPSDQILTGRPVAAHLVAVAAAAVLGFPGNEIVARYRIRVGRQIGSAALVADGCHRYLRERPPGTPRTDGFTSLAVLSGGAAVGDHGLWSTRVIHLATNWVEPAPDGQRWCAGPGGRGSR